MKYIRTKDEHNLIINLSSMVIPFQIVENIIDFNRLGRFEIIKQADTIEELCDEFVGIDKDGHYLIHNDKWLDGARIVPLNEITYYGAIWTDKGLTYVAKMNDKGVLELL